MKQITLFFFILLPFLGITQQDSSVFYTGRGNLKLSNGKFTITRPNGNLIANFPAYLLKPQFDSLLNHYNDTTDKSGISCVDSLWKVGNIVYHRNWNCDVQSFAIDPPTVDGCSGGYVYKKSAITDTIGLIPNPSCGDVFVATADTCFDYIYTRGHTPSKWNLIGNYLKNVNCAVGQLHYNVGDGLGKSVKLSGVQDPDNARFRSIKGAGAISVKTVGDNIIVADSLGNLYIFENVGNGAFVIKDTTNKVIKIRSVKGLGCIKAVVNNDVIEVQDTCVAASDYKFTNVGGKAEVLKDTLNRLIKYRTIEGLNGIKVTQNTNTISIEDTTSLPTDYRFRNYGTGVPVLKDTLNRLIKYYAIKGSGNVLVTLVGDDIVISDSYIDTLQKLNTLTSNASSFKVELDKDKSTNFEIKAGFGITYDNNLTGATGIVRINVDTNSVAFKKNNYAVANVGTGVDIYKNTTGFDPKTFNLRRLRSSDNTVLTTQNADDIDLRADVNNRDSMMNTASNYQIDTRHYAKGILIGSTTLTAGNNIEFSSPFSGEQGGLVINAIDPGACTPLSQGIFSGKYVFYDDVTRCLKYFNCGTTPCDQPPPAPPLIMGFETDETDIPLNSQFLTFDNTINKWVATDITNQPIGTYLGGATQVLGIGGGNIPSGWIGEDFNIPVDYSPATSALDLGFHAIYINGVVYSTGSGVTAPIIGTDDATIQNFINSALIAGGYAANDLIWVSNSNNTVTIWRNPAYAYNLNDFWMGTMTPNNYTNKYYPTTPTTHAPPTGGLALYTIPAEKRYQSFASAGATVDVTSGANTASGGFTNLTASDLALDKSKIDVYINGLKHSYTTSPSPSTYLSYTVSGSQITAYSGTSTIGINQIEVIIKP